MNAIELIRKCTFEQAKKFIADIPEGFTHYSFEHQAFINYDLIFGALESKPYPIPERKYTVQVHNWGY
ncbi:hypothetical protein [Acinetobacter baumannii]|uniref:hypothetical protein n=1 Tax=Acinetobacter baumannii TaxID=470 RepID=UPI003891785E